MAARRDHERRFSNKKPDVFVQPSDHKGSGNGSGSGVKDGDLRLRRLFGFVQLLGFSINFMNSWEVIAIFVGSSFWNGGPRALAWGSLLVICGAMTQAMSMAELGSILPIAGAQYHWTEMLAPESHKRFITWMQGWITWFAWVSALAGSTSGLGALLQSLIASNDPGYVAPRWQLTVIMIALLVAVGLINMYAFKIVPWMELLAGILHVLLWVVFIAVLLSLGPRKSNDEVFFDSTTLSGWSGHPCVAFNLGMLVPAWGFIGFDGVVHMSEEVRMAKQAVPRSMILTIAINGALAYIFGLVLLFTRGGGDVFNAGYPIIPILYNATGSMAAVNALVSMILIIVFAVVAASLASVSRITWAWARDGALPKYFAHVDTRHKVPIRALWLPIIIVSLLSLLNIGSTAATAFYAFTALSSLGLYLSYIIAISCLIHARLTGRLSYRPGAPVPYGGWKLWNGFGTLINVIALLWTIYITIWLPFPSTIPATGSNMNYAAPIFGFVVIAALLYWVLWARKKWSGLNADAVNIVKRAD